MNATYISLKCENCQSLFVWSAEEQELYKKRGIEQPKYCPICRGMMEARNNDRARQKLESNSKNS